MMLSVPHAYLPISLFVFSFFFWVGGGLNSVTVSVYLYILGC